jgi:DNA repair exonuclease SbcCD nuclease subunit
VKILHTGDNHFAPTSIEEAVKCFKHVIKIAKTEKVNLVINAGDWFDKNMLMNSPARRESVRLLCELADIAPIIMIRGNHDPEGSLDEFPMLRTKYPIHLFTEITHRVFEVDDPYEIITVPYIKKSDFSIPENMALVTADKYVATKIISQFANLPPKKYPRFFIGHLTITNASLANSQTISSNDVLISPVDLQKAKADAYFLGHIHQHEQSILEGLPIKYSGPHYRTRFDEQQELGFWIWEDGEWYRHKTPARRALTIHLTEEEVRNYIDDHKSLDLAKYAEDWEEMDIKIKLDVQYYHKILLGLKRSLL